MGMKLQGKKLVITLKLNKPSLSSSGKTLLVGSTRGVKKSAVTVGDKPVHFVANAWVKHESHRSSRKKGKKQKAAKKT